jgi:hypothetical protein
MCGVVYEKKRKEKMRSGVREDLLAEKKEKGKK